MTWWQFLLFPFAMLFDLVTRLRNQLYDKALIKPFQFETNVIGIGNLSVGGTGKSPMVAYLIELLSDSGYEVSTLSRGYKRSTKGFRIASEKEDAKSLGDEPFMFYRRYGDKTHVAVGEERILAIPELLLHFPQTEVVLLDDIFQHRTVKPSLNILLTTYQQPFYEDFLLPSGRLRESRKGADRADVIIVTKCPEQLSEAEQRMIKDRMSIYSDARVFFTGISYGEPVPFFGEKKKPENKVVGISGIANGKLFHQEVETRYSVMISHQYGDHHKYTALDVKGIIAELNSKNSLITTEKDAVKLLSFNELKSYSCFYIPIEVKFLKDESLFKSIIENSIKDYQQ